MNHNVRRLGILTCGGLLLFLSFVDISSAVSPQPVRPQMDIRILPSVSSQPRLYPPWNMPGSDPRTWSPYPLNPWLRPIPLPVPMPGSDPRTWSPYPLYPPVYPVPLPVPMPGSDPRTWSPYPISPPPNPYIVPSSSASDILPFPSVNGSSATR